jgi:hypothetical protein
MRSLFCVLLLAGHVLSVVARDYKYEYVATNAIFSESRRIDLPCGPCGPGWGSLQECEAQCNDFPNCSHITYFDDQGCRIYNTCHMEPSNFNNLTTTIMHRSKKLDCPCQYECDPEVVKAGCYCPLGNPFGCSTMSICNKTSGMDACCPEGTVLEQYHGCTGCGSFCCKGDQQCLRSSNCCGSPVEPGSLMDRCEKVLGYPPIAMGAYLCVRPRNTARLPTARAFQKQEWQSTEGATEAKSAAVTA